MVNEQEVQDLLNQDALKELHSAYTKNYVWNNVIKEATQLLIESTKQWFKDNWYEDPDTKLASNEDFLERANKDEKEAEIIKTQYTTHWTELNELKGQAVKVDVEIDAAIRWLKKVLSLIK